MIYEFAVKLADWLNRWDNWWHHVLHRHSFATKLGIGEIELCTNRITRNVSAYYLPEGQEWGTGASFKITNLDVLSDIIAAPGLGEARYIAFQHANAR